MIETTVASLITIKPVLQQLANTEMPARESFKILRMLKNIDKEYEVIESTQRKMLEAYGEKDENGNYIPDEHGGLKIKMDCMTVFTEEMNSLLATKVELDCNKLSLDLLDKMYLTPNQLLKMEDFIEE